MSNTLFISSPAHSSTPKSRENISNTRRSLETRTMSSQVEVKHVSVDGKNGSVQRTTMERSYSSGGVKYSAGESKIIPSSYQLRFGGRNRSGGYGYGYGRTPVVEASVTRVTVSDGLEMTPSLITSRAEEKATLGSLNDRFVSYIENVRGLASRNQVLEAKVKQLEACQTIPSRAGDMYDAQLHKLQREIEKAISDKTQVEIQLEGCYRELEGLRKKLEREIEDRKDAENEAKSLCKDVDQATLVRVELEGKVESLREELDLVRRANDEDIRVLTEQLQSLRTGDVVVDGSQPTDLSEALRDIRAAYEQLTQNNKLEIEGYYKAKIAELTGQVRDENNANKNYKSEAVEVRRQLQSVTVELEGLRTSNAALENQLEDVENRYQNEVANCHKIIEDLERDLNATKDKVQRQLVDYNELLHLKLSLDLEIQTYRKLLEGEESRINVSGINTSLLSDKVQINVVERVVSDGFQHSDDVIDEEAINMLKDVVEDAKLNVKTEIIEATQAGQLVEEQRNERKDSSSSSSSSSSDSESEI